MDRKKPVWARANITLDQCPRSYITAESEALLEEFLVRRRLGGLQFSQLTARQAEAFVMLEGLLVAEIKDGEQSRRTTSR